MSHIAAIIYKKLGNLPPMPDFVVVISRGGCI